MRHQNPKTVITQKDGEQLTSSLKLKSGGKGRPLGKRAWGSRSSSKKGWAQASSCKDIHIKQKDKFNCHI